jgi:dihydropteroate synthase
MQSLTHYENLLNDIILHLKKQIDRAHENGAYDLIIDPGFGFAKTPDQNFSLLNNLECFKILGKPVLAGLSRKSMIWKTLECQPEEALNGTTALNMVALLKGASILRVHDVKEANECIKLFCKLVTSK